MLESSKFFKILYGEELSKSSIYKIKCIHENEKNEIYAKYIKDGDTPATKIFQKIEIYELVTDNIIFSLIKNE